jgi:hypothetical protein
VSPASQLPFYFTIQPGRPYPYVTARLSVARARQTVAQLPLTLDRPANGVIRQVTRVAVGGLEPGSYSLVLTVTDGASTVIRSAPFEIR